MTKTISFSLLALSCLVGPLVSVTRGQAIPTATADVYYPGFHLPNVGGSLNYSVSASESVIFGYNGENGGTAATTNLSGNVAYLSSSERHPFSMVYSGGYFFSTSGQPSAFYQDLALSQVYKTKTWDFVVSDLFSYLPETATVGLSGVPGVGDLGVDPLGGAYGSVQGILTRNGPRVDNSVSASATKSLTASTSLSFTGFGYFETFLGDSNDLSGNYVAGIDSRSEGGSVALNHRLNALSSVGTSYTYSTSTFTGSQFSFNSQQVNFIYNRQLSRKLSFVGSVGPQWTSSSDPLYGGTSVTVATNVGLAYSAKFASASVDYSRGTSSGFGVFTGAHTDSVDLIAHRALGKNWSASVSADYARSTSLPSSFSQPYSTQTEVAGVQASRSLSRKLSLFTSYTLQRQTTDGTNITPVAFTGHSQVISVGITFSPSSTRLDQP